MSSMFCYQCEQTSQMTGCTAFGVCGKDPETAVLQDLLIHAMKGISMYAHRSRQAGVKTQEVDAFILEGLFTTVTNVNFDPERMETELRRAAHVLDKARDDYRGACAKQNKTFEELGGPAQWKPEANLQGLISQGEGIGIEKRIDKCGADAAGLQELITYGLKGLGAYAHHAYVLERESDEVYAFIHEALDFLAGEPTDIDQLFNMTMRCGEISFKVLAMLDEANSGTYGTPIPTKVPVTPVKGKAILVSGHDLKDMEELLIQTEGKGINVYTHGEMLPAHGYPKLKQHSHFIGNYGGAWQDQRDEFEQFPGAILMTTNCIQKPKETYIHRIFTSGKVAWPRVKHIANRDFTPVIESALAESGFAEDEPAKEITLGFAHGAVLQAAEKVIELVKAGKIKHFFFIGGCDGAKTGRNYFTEFATSVPKDCIILTAGCGKFRFNKLEFGDIEGIPRLLDCGQCNDSFSAIKIAVALAEAFKCDVNQLPLSLIVSWYEQKAVAVLLTLLHLGVKNIRLGPMLPAFVSPNVLKVLVEKFNLQPIHIVETDIAACMSK